MKKSYEVPAVESLGSIVEITAAFGGTRGDLIWGSDSGCKDYFGGGGLLCSGS